MVGEMLVEWVWGGFGVSGPTLRRFFALHYLLPFVVVLLRGMHLFFLHETGSSNPLGCDRSLNRVGFHPYFTMKDYVGVLFILICLWARIVVFPSLLIEPDNFLEAGARPKTPEHIKPE